jgi:hypothetical protein
METNSLTTFDVALNSQISFYPFDYVCLELANIIRIIREV